MAVAKSNSSSESSTKAPHCYKVESLKETILDTDQTSNLKDRFVLGEQLGWGQFGIIRACSDKLAGEVLACKSIAKDRLVTQDDVRSVKLEIEIMTKLSGHPNVVDLKAVYEEEDYVHLVMELCAGGELFHQLEKHGRFSEAEARVLFRHLMEVVMYCHDKVLAEFVWTVGSPFYIAPEVLAGGYNQAADVWSAGVILYILLSGMPPFWGKTKSRIFDAVRAADLRFPSDPWDQLSGSAEELIRGMLCRDPSQRLTAQEVLDHSWIRDHAQSSEEPREHENQSYEHLGEGGSSFSTFMTRNQDISFGTGPRVICDAQSPQFTCRSSFTSFGLEPSTPCFASGGFSFGSTDEPNTLEFSSPVPSMPSFAFFSPCPITVQESYTLDLSANISTVNAIQKEASLGRLFMLSDSSVCLGHEAKDIHYKTAEVKRTGGTSGYRMSGIHKRNRTIGLGEFDQLDLVVTESVIRWASCTHLPTASSLRSSLVC
ncbi:Calcium-dependent protein kinase 17 [Vitis vinifera]|uniref:non-specific serine/threonine protein kinase n=1 Tax=Vitis vinifera TaxID=29760 RepID=A0A438GWS6_VITVI|nr:Calcium-dependent protein kinase 17 [Vitis vinifera]